MKKYIILILGSILFNVDYSRCAEKNPFESIARVNIAEIQAYQGDLVDVPLTVTGFQNIGMFQLDMAFNPDVLESVNVVNIHPNLGSITKNLEQDGLIFTNWYNINGASIPDGDKLFDLRFIFCPDSLDCALSENASAIEFIESTCLARRPDYTEIALNFNHGSVSAIDPLRSLAINTTGSGEVNVNGTPYTEPLAVPEGTILTLDAIAETGWSFTGWSGDQSGAENPIELLMDSNKNVTVIFEVIPASAHTIKLFLEGFYSTTLGEMRKAQWFNPFTEELEDKFDGTVADLITVELHEPGSYGTPVYVFEGVGLNQDGTANFFIEDPISGEFYITIRHRNHLETVSATPLDFDQGVTYDFTASADKAFGNNMQEISDGIWGLFAGDVNQDGTLSGADLVVTNDDVRIGAVGYRSTDVNGDGVLSGADLVLINDNVRIGVVIILPE